MVLFVSDLHYDHRPPPKDPLISAGDHAERELIACLNYYRPELTHVVLLGDLFDAWIEYRDLVPKGLTRLFGLLAHWADQGLRVTVVTGNHDPWHRDYLERHLGFRVLRHSAVETLEGRLTAFGHGDQEEHGGMTAWQRFIRSRFVHTLYAESFPGGFGLWLARMWSRGARSSRLDPELVAALRTHAHGLLKAGTADTVVFAHCHLPQHDEVTGGSYVNTGSWALHRSFATLDAGGIRLRTWPIEAKREAGT
ncbi:MAG: UDP-2,3-diacylglucosamine hydrolase [Rhodothermales bacterium]